MPFMRAHAHATLRRVATLAVTVAASAPLALADTVTGLVPEHVEHVAGRFHIMLVHFPIALILVAGFFGIMSAIRRSEQVSPVAFHCLWTGALGALVAAGTGWLFAHHDPPSASVESDLFWHRWVGVATAATSLLAVLFYLLRRRSSAPALVKGSRLFFVLAVILAGGAGHLGGDLAYGEGWIFAPLEAAHRANDATSDPAPVVAAPDDEPVIEEPVDEGTGDVATPVALIDYATQIEPIFEATCIRCHGARRQKGQLRLDQGAEIFAVEPKWWVVQPGDADDSLLVQLIELPRDDLDVMPPEEPLLTADQIALIRAWVDQGAPIDGVVHEAPSTDGG